MSERPYPFSADWQEELLGILIIDPEFARRNADAVVPEAFDDPAAVTVAQALRSVMRSAYTPASVIEACHESKAWTRRSPKEREAIESVVRRSARAARKADRAGAEVRLRKFLSVQAMTSALAQADALKDEPERHGEIIKAVQSATHVGSSPDRGIDVFADFAARHAWLVSDAAIRQCIPTPLKLLDASLHGGFGRGELSMIMAGMGIGKSMFLGACGAAAAKHRRKILHYTLEMSDIKTALRYDFNFSRIGRTEMTKMSGTDPKLLDHQRRLSTYRRVGARLYVKGAPARSCTVDMISSEVRRWAAEGEKPDLLIVDYADLLRSPRKWDERRMELADLYADLRTLAVEHDVAVLTASQVRRGAIHAEVIDIADVAEDISKAAICDVILALCRTAKDREGLTARVHVAKNRDGIARQVIPVRMDFEHMRISEERGKGAGEETAE